MQKCNIASFVRAGAQSSFLGLANRAHPPAEPDVRSPGRHAAPPLPVYIGVQQQTLLRLRQSRENNNINERVKG